MPPLRVVGNAIQAQRAAGQRFRVEDSDAHHLAERERSHCQVHARKSQRGLAEEVGNDHWQRDARKQRHGEGRLVVHREDGRRISAQAHEGRVRQRQHAARQGDVDGQRQQGVDAQGQHQVAVDLPEILKGFHVALAPRPCVPVCGRAGPGA
ncbi:hypothetical protein SDC9_91210 [bioreactor metagenome]|uniref:Uncharacterized protein n=1 Tax=bioreactor metagenome TaxID=1076179 RepID=A0A644ZUJ8_9ZZZZ